MPRPGPSQMTPYERSLLDRENRSRQQAEDLRRQKKYSEAITAAEQALQFKQQRTRMPPSAEDQKWLTDLRNERLRAMPATGIVGEAGVHNAGYLAGLARRESECRAKVERLRQARRFEAALETAKKALDWKRQRTSRHIDAEDQEWLTKLSIEMSREAHGLGASKAEEVLRMEYRDKWFDISKHPLDRGKMARSINEAKETLESKQGQLGQQHAEVAAARARFEEIEERRNELVEQLQQQLQRRDRAFVQGEFATAADSAEVVVDLCEQVYGEGDLITAVAAGEWGRIAQRDVQFAWSPKAFSLAEQIFTEIYGETHWRVRHLRVELEEGAKLGTQAGDMRWRTFMSTKLLERGHYYDAIVLAGEDRRFFTGNVVAPRSYLACSLASRARVLRAYGAYWESVPAQRDALESLRELYGEEHPDYVEALGDQYVAYTELGDFAKAQTTARRAAELARIVWGPEHPRYAASLVHLGEAHLNLGQTSEAKPFLDRALWISERHFAQCAVLYTDALCLLAEVGQRLGNLDAAKKLLEHALKNRLANPGPGHSKTVETRASLACLDVALGNFTEAEKLYQVVTDRPIHDWHPQHARHLADLARMHQINGDHDKAEPLLQQSLEHLRRNLDGSFDSLSERQQLAMTANARDVLFTYLDSATQLGLPGEKAYRHLLAWKGAVFARRRLALEAVVGDEDAPLLKKLQETSRQLATLAMIRPAPEQEKGWRESVDKLTDKKERLESDLAGRSEEFRKSRQKVTLESLQAALPADAALVDFLDYTVRPSSARPGDEPARQLVAFVVRRGRDVVQVDLGPVTPIREAGEQWRRLIVRRGGGVSKTDRGLRLLDEGNDDDASPEPPQDRLRALVWQPLEAHLEGVDNVLVSPDGVTASLPLAALPGSEPGKYLIEERSLIVVPVPGQLPQLLADGEAKPADDDKGPSLMLLGDVDFAAAAGTTRLPEDPLAMNRPRSAVRSADTVFRPLPGTAREVAAIAKLHHERFGAASLEEIRGTAATEARLRDSAAKHRVLHLATHGFFAPAKEASAAETPAGATASVLRLHPGLMSGLAMAGANRPAEVSTAEDTDTVTDDGVLTALEVAALDLRGVDLAVLSACETGLGETASGEGVLGLQRAFQTAGADATVTSLWKVDDVATETLMVEFYRVLWEEKTGKLEALRRAQLAMLDRYDPTRKELRPRGLVLLDKNTNQTAAKPARLSPYYWAAFVLSGDWR